METEDQNQQNYNFNQYEYKKRKDQQELDIILNKYPDLDFNVPLTNTNQTWLHLAVLSGHQELVISLIEKGVDINQQDSAGRTAFIIACGMGNKSIIEILLKNPNLDRNKTTIGGENALMKLAFNAHLSLMDFFISNNVCKIDQQNNLQQNVFDILYSHNQYGYVQFYVKQVYSLEKKLNEGNNQLIYDFFKPLFKHEIQQNNIDFVIKINEKLQLQQEEKKKQYEQYQYQQMLQQQQQQQ
ncbi:Ankyrin repeat-containing domain [Pseudocohnilembus persalinus]|uniref:Ankyrin repeat-containing domain n=1 Tax=Pseudocohnilembus persalinus TaxID=266149 RepID=A0A0V0Q894_PSEPJ|nr:Ankyrin repeat-containing domain [Pseudocohnilembus persalinus]|eukprot:KRW98461.1 Ankyrin repeat-containing domain [Pseudocohnilembus persalinus]